MAAYDDRRLWPGTEPPVGGSPRRRKGSVRRTTCVDVLRPDGIAGPVVLVGTARDLATGIDSNAYLVDAGATAVTIDFMNDRTVTSVVCDQDVKGLDALVGLRAGSGFRRAMAGAVPDLVESGSLIHQLLDDTPPAVLISGSVLARLGLLRLDTPERTKSLPVNICAGWAEGGAMFQAIAETGIPLLGWGPPAPSLDVEDDELAWHPLEDLPPRSMRRRRLIDVWRGVGPELRVDARFRDTYGEDDGTETVVHEYAVNARVDIGSWSFTEVSAVPGPLPAPECPTAATSVSRLVGRDVTSARDTVRDEFTGISTCTHLNDVMRSLADVRRLWQAASMSRGEVQP